jgi:hypothetical protein
VFSTALLLIDRDDSPRVRFATPDFCDEVSFSPRTCAKLFLTAFLARDRQEFDFCS